jgi:hypothetical protein
MYWFPSNFWRSKITNGKESDKCDLCKTLWISQGRFTTESVLPVQTLVHIQHTCEALSEIHTMVHRCWCLIHRVFTASSAWRFICTNNEKSFRTVWTELSQEFPEVFNHCVESLLHTAFAPHSDWIPLTVECSKRLGDVTPINPYGNDT